MFYFRDDYDALTFTIDSVDKVINISVCIDSFNSVNISGSKLNASNSMSLDLFSGTKFSIKSAESAGCNSLRVLLRKSVSFSLIFLLKTFSNFSVMS